VFASADARVRHSDTVRVQFSDYTPEVRCLSWTRSAYAAGQAPSIADRVCEP
jgi:hypothetical protein